MAFRLLNIGDGQTIIKKASVTVTNGYTYSHTGKAFKGLVNSSYSYTYYTFTLPDYIAEDIWIKLDLYIDSTQDANNFYLGYWNSQSTYNDKNFFWLEGLYLSSGVIRINMRNNYNSTSAKATLEKQAINEIWCHMHNEVGANASLGELNVNGILTSQTITKAPETYAIGSNEEALKTMVIAFPRDYPCYVSNLIISDTAILPKERVIELPIGSTSTTMVAGASGIYYADVVGETLLQTPDVSALTTSYGANSTVTGIAVVGNPAYNITNGVSELIGVSKSGGSLAEHGVCNLSTDTTASVMDGWRIENTTIADLQNTQFGWKVRM